MKRNQSALKPKTKFQQLPLISPNVTFLRERKSTFITRNLKKKKTRLALNPSLPSIKNDKLQKLTSSIIKSKECTKEFTNDICNELPSSLMTETAISTLIPYRNLYKEIIEDNLKNQVKEYDDNDSQMSRGRKTKLNIPRPKIKGKIDLNKKIKEISPVIDDLDEFVNVIKEKHKDLFEKMIPMLFKQQKPQNIDQDFRIPLLLYEDYKYFMNRFFPRKIELKPMSFGDSNMLYPSLLDYSSYIQKFTEYISHFKSDKFIENALNFDNKFYADFLRKIQGKDMKIISFNKTHKRNALKEGRLDEKYQKFIKELNNKAFKSSNSVDSSNDNNAIRSILKKHNNINKQLFYQGYKGKRKSSFDLEEEDGNDNKDENIIYVDDDMSKSNSVSEVDEFIELHSQVDSKRSNSYLDNSYIFQKNAGDKENHLKFSVQIKKNIMLEKKKEQSLYDKYFGRLNKRFFKGI